ncbi:MAG: phenylalanine--tRNA ligase subunit beta [Parcubacteria group bacterium]|nr:phenylalanine--tRNA ligase subunit beta [Parcubacteria group bacterium]
MKVSLDWLSDFVTLPRISPAELGELITQHLIETESVAKVNPHAKGIVVGEILEIRPHPNADKLQLVLVAVGNKEEPLEIVCGAHNIAKGQKVPVALIGATVPVDVKGDGKPWVLKETVIRNVTSQGMLCSPKELAVADDTDGILILPPETKAGSDIREVLGFDDWVIDIDLKSNRPDALSHVGVARDLAAFVPGAKLTKRFYLAQSSKLKAQSDFLQPSALSLQQIKVAIDAPELCPRYIAALVEGITIQPSPLWIQNRLRAIGMRPINNVVDATNYVMAEVGQPLHAFDIKKLLRGGGGAITIGVRMSREGERLTTLDGKERSLSPETLLITNEGIPVALAGIMGGAATEIDRSTTSILLEAANFDPMVTAKASRALGLRSEASHRFEKGIDPTGASIGVTRLLALLRETCPTLNLAAIHDEYVTRVSQVHLTLDSGRLNRVLALKLRDSEIVAMLTRLGFDLKKKRAHLYEVGVPTFRVDIHGEEDLIEEVARIQGYDEISLELPRLPAVPRRMLPIERMRRLSRHLLTTQGFTEVATYAYESEESIAKLGLNPDEHFRIANPLSREQAYLRSELLGSLLGTTAENLRYTSEVALFEIARVFLRGEGRAPREVEVLGLTATVATDIEADFLRVKGVVESLHESRGFEKSSYTFVPLREEERLPHLPEELRVVASLLLRTASALIVTPDRVNPVRSSHGALSAMFAADEFGIHPRIKTQGILPSNGVKGVGLLGVIDPRLTARFDISKQVICYYESLEEAGKSGIITVKISEPPRYPEIVMDVAFVTGEETELGTLLSTLLRHSIPFMVGADIFDVFRDEKIGQGKKSVALRLTYRAADRTLTDEEAKRSHEKVIQFLKERYQAEIR